MILNKKNKVKEIMNSRLSQNKDIVLYFVINMINIFILKILFTREIVSIFEFQFLITNSLLVYMLLMVSKTFSKEKHRDIYILGCTFILTLYCVLAYVTRAFSATYINLLTWDVRKITEINDEFLLNPYFYTFWILPIITTVYKIKDRKINVGLAIKNYFKGNKMIMVLIVINVINEMLLRAKTINSVTNLLDVRTILADIAVISLLLCFANLFKKSKTKKIYLFAITFFLSIICIINSSYYVFYSSFSSISLLSTTKYLGEVSTALNEIVKPIDFIYLVLPIAYLVYIIKRKSTISENKSFKKFFQILITSIICNLLFVATMKGVDYSRIIKQWNRFYIVERFGLYVYHVNDIVQTTQSNLVTLFGHDSANKELDTYFSKVPEHQTYTNKFTNIFKGKNLISIHGESLQTFLINKKINGKEVTPNMNRLINQGMNFSNYYSQVSVGTSADSEFTINTGLMPAKVGVAFVSYADRNYEALPKEFKKIGYKTLSFHGNSGNFWNRNIMYKSLGYDRFYQKKDYKIDETIGLGISDKSFFRQTVDKMVEESKSGDPFYATVIMLSNHTPFFDVDKYTKDPLDLTMDVNGQKAQYMENTLLGRYIKSVHYADEALGEFIDELEQKGLLDNSVIMLYGDHDARISANEYNRMNNYDPVTNSVKPETTPGFDNMDYFKYELNRKVPFFIWSKKDNNIIRGEYPQAMGAYHIKPTIGNMFGFYTKYNLVPDIIEVKPENSLVIFPNGNFVDNKYYYSYQSGELYDINEHKLVDKELIPKEYLKEKIEKTQQLLNVSDKMLVFDYLRKDNDHGKKRQ